MQTQRPLAYPLQQRARQIRRRECHKIIGRLNPQTTAQIHMPKRDTFRDQRIGKRQHRIRRLQKRRQRTNLRTNMTPDADHTQRRLRRRPTIQRGRILQRHAKLILAHPG